MFEDVKLDRWHRHPALRWALGIGVWTLFGLFFGTQLYQIYARVLERPISWGEALATTMPEWYAWGVLAPLIVRLARRARLEHLGLMPGLQLHLIAGALFSLAHVLLALGFRWAWTRTTGTISLWPSDILVATTVNIQWNYLTYWAILGLSQAADYYRRYQDEGARAAQLSARLAEARLDALRAQLQPHFLFNTLNGISALMHEDVDAADQMLIRLSDLLRYLLDHPADHQVTLEQELDLLDRYLKIEQARFPDRLRIQLDVAPETRAARVPNLLLQPLVENAVRHGVAPRPGAGRIQVRTRRARASLEVEVEDDGPGLAGGRASPAEGIGLGNTRARLQQLFGEEQRLDLTNVPGGGLLVRMIIPFETAPATARVEA